MCDHQQAQYDWSQKETNTYQVSLVTDPAEMQRAVTELTDGVLSAYVVIRVEGGGTESLRRMIEVQHFLCRPPTKNELWALEKGFEILNGTTS